MLSLLGVIIAFVLVIILIRLKFNFGLSLILGSLVVGIFSRDAISGAIRSSYEKQQLVGILQTVGIDTETIELALLMTLIFILAKCMQDIGAIKKLIDSLRTFFSKGGTIAIIPAIYGLMPVPGGALFSAPMVDKEGDKFGLNKDIKNYLNVWFRHIWFPIHPISSAMILICSKNFSDISIYDLMLANIPAFIITIIIGIVVLKKVTHRIPETPQKISLQKKNYRGLIYLLPPLIPIFSYGLIKVFDLPQNRSLILSIILSLILLFFLTKISIKEYAHIMRKALTWKLAAAIFGIMIFKQMITNSGATEVIGAGIVGTAIPSILLIILIPLVLGIITGYNLGAVALSYPLLLPFRNDFSIISFTSIIFISSLVGYLISPIHLCNVVSSEYLKTDITRIYKLLIPSVLLLLLVNTVIAILFI